MQGKFGFGDITESHLSPAPKTFLNFICRRGSDLHSGFISVDTTGVAVDSARSASLEFDTCNLEQ